MPVFRFLGDRNLVGVVSGEEEYSFLGITFDQDNIMAPALASRASAPGDATTGRRDANFVTKPKTKQGRRAPPLQGPGPRLYMSEVR